MRTPTRTPVSMRAEVRDRGPIPRPSEGATNRGVREMLFYEALAKARIREAEEEARRYRIARRLIAGRRWAWLARYASARAERARLTA